MIDIIELMANLFESLDKHFLPFLSKKLRAVAFNFKNDFYKKMLVLHLEEQKKLQQELNTNELVKNTLAKNGLDTSEQDAILKKLKADLLDNNAKVERLKGVFK